jgi:acyl-CoA reductase-like NAD-dependent aldehyde dehydrogenase
VETQSLPLSRREWLEMAHVLRQREHKPYADEGQREAAADRMRRYRAKNQKQFNAAARAKRAAAPEKARAACLRWYHKTKEQRAELHRAKERMRTHRKQLAKLLFCCLLLERVSRSETLSRNYADWCAAQRLLERHGHRGAFADWYRRERKKQVVRSREARARDRLRKAVLLGLVSSQCVCSAQIPGETA